ncbi:hypothetical protein [Thioalkalivibrio thiocyanodenitrificans]|uniref:hypothetical protein n=1 Tax=Thioalkalivibrio thiocyanodenitrificans TaxID=243063 RepID=UPI00037C4EBE|nr:hypothetical protein [Thioalkalivibrio thiocyanodenitrificans]
MKTRFFTFLTAFSPLSRALLALVVVLGALGSEAAAQVRIEHGGQSPFYLSPTNGYPGSSTELRIGSRYEAFEDGVRRFGLISSVSVDWGDGSPAQVLSRDSVTTHQYGTREPDGTISPNIATRYRLRLTFYTTIGVYTEYAFYRLWVSRESAMGRGRGRTLIDRPEGGECSEHRVPGLGCVYETSMIEHESGPMCPSNAVPGADLGLAGECYMILNYTGPGQRPPGGSYTPDYRYADQ